MRQPRDVSTPELESSRQDSQLIARQGAVSLFGSATSAIMGFILTVVLARTLGDVGSGVVLQAVAVFTIVLSLARAGMDSAAVWIMPRLVVHNPDQIRSALGTMFFVTALSSTVCAIGIAILSPSLARGGDLYSGEVVRAVTLAGWFLPAGALLLVALAATRGLGGIIPYLSVGSIGLPVVRPIIVWLVATAGGSFVAVTVAWAAPLPVALIAAAVILRVQIRKHERAAAVRGSWRPRPALWRSIVNYALPRTVSAGLEQSLIWLDVIMVGVIAGSAAAGIYGGASRFVAAGLIIDTALRIVVSTRFSTLLFEKKHTEVEALYRVAATLLVLFGTPVYLLLAVFAPVVLSWLGPGFNQGATALVILCVGATLAFTAGNIQSVLLMSGRSGWAAINKGIVLLVNVAGNLVLIPLIGITGAALSWAFCMLLDATLATIEVRRFLGIRMGVGAIAYALLVALATFGVPAITLRIMLGDTAQALFLSIASGSILFIGWCALDRKRLHLHDFRIITRRH